jgi:3-isopropylmalate dehydratase small subunit
VEPLVRLSAEAAPLDLPNVDTDRVNPTRFFRNPRRAGYVQFCFHDLRVRPAGPEHVTVPSTPSGQTERGEG